MALIALKPPATWDTVPAGLIASSQEMTLDNLVASDSFGTGTLDPTLWDTDIVPGSGAASIVEAGGEVKISTDTVNAGAILNYKDTLNPRATNRWGLRSVVSAENVSVAGSMVAASLIQSIGLPAVGDAATLQGNMLCEIDILSLSGGYDLRIRYFNTGGVSMYWNGLDWGSVSSIAYRLGLNEVFGLEIENDGTNLIFRIYDIDFTVVKMYASIPLTSVRAEANDLYLMQGDPFNNAWYGDLLVKEFSHRGDYGTGLITQMGLVAVDTVIDQFPITVDAESGASILWRYDVGAGWVTPGGGTLAELSAALIGTSPATLDLEATFTSDGEANVLFDINGGVMSGGEGAIVVSPLEVIEIEELEVIEL